MACDCVVNLIMQGDQYWLPFIITDEQEQSINVDNVETIEFCIGDLKRYFGGQSGEVVYDNVNKQFLFPISQQESLEFAGQQRVQVRVKTIDGLVVGRVYGYIDIQFGESEEIL